ncbi:MAG TPA: hypothetical protein VD793_01290 [Gemmatimonadales bacterium]|nr:hypothetical protein [Gemmatimonadales bacterium]
MATPIHEQQDAKETLAYIRQTMESASTFTAIAGWGLIAVGGLGLLAAGLAWSTGVPADLRVWIPAAVLSIGVAGASTATKARRIEAPLWSGSLRKIVWVMSPALVSGALLTYALLQANAAHLLPGTWLALYGAGVSAGGVFSVRALRWMGLEFVILGAVALLVPQTGLTLLALGFGGLHLGFGAYIVRRHGG